MATSSQTIVGLVDVSVTAASCLRLRHVRGNDETADFEADLNAENNSRNIVRELEVSERLLNQIKRSMAIAEKK